MEDYAKRLGVVLRTFNPGEMRKFIQENRSLYGKGYPDMFLENDDEFIRGMMAEMVMNRNDMSYNDKEKAKEILRKLDWKWLL